MARAATDQYPGVRQQTKNPIDQAWRGRGGRGARRRFVDHGLGVARRIVDYRLFLDVVRKYGIVLEQRVIERLRRVVQQIGRNLLATQLGKFASQRREFVVVDDDETVLLVGQQFLDFLDTNVFDRSRIGRRLGRRFAVDAVVGRAAIVGNRLVIGRNERQTRLLGGLWRRCRSWRRRAAPRSVLSLDLRQRVTSIDPEHFVGTRNTQAGTR